jgi:hypothetical protein
MFKNAMVLVGAVVACLCSAYTPAAAQQVNWNWTTQYGSKLSVTSYNSNNGQISGTYTNQASGSCDMGKPQLMTGWYVPANNGSAISFTVNFLGCSSSTVWTGQLNSDTSFQGIWLLSLAAPVAWNGVNAGADTFTWSAGDKSELMRKQ